MPISCVQDLGVATVELCLDVHLQAAQHLLSIDPTLQVLSCLLVWHFHERKRAEPVQSAGITQHLEHSAVHHRKASVMFTQPSPA